MVLLSRNRKASSKYVVPLIFLVTFLLVGSVGCGGGDGGETSGVDPDPPDSTTDPVDPDPTATTGDMTAQPLKEPFIGLHWRGLAQYSYKPDNDTIEEYVEYNTLRHSENSRMDAVVLVVSWRDLQPVEDTDEFPELYQAIYNLKNNGFQVVLYVWANAAENWQAWPDWLKTDSDQE